MHSILLAVAMAVAGPSVPEPPVAAAGRGGETIGVVWHDQATVALAVQQRLANDLADAVAVEAARPVVVSDARGRAAVRIAQQLPRSALGQGVAWRARLDEARSAYRAGELEAAQRRLTGLLAEIRGAPVVPGAAGVAWRAQVLLGQLAWAQGDDEGLQEALAAAVALDPDARLSTRRVPPRVVAAYQRQQDRIVGDRSGWRSLQISEPNGEPFSVEIDGIPGARPVPPGEHVVVVRRAGRPPVGVVLDSGMPWSISEEPSIIEPGLPRTEDAAQRICDAAGLSWLLLARRRDGRLGLQRFQCAVGGFGPVWYGDDDGSERGLSHVLERGRVDWAATPMLHRDAPWPEIVVQTEPPAPVWMADRESTPTRRARLRRALPWLLIGGVVAGAVVVGVVVGTDPGADLSIDGDSFLRPRGGAATGR